MFTHVYLLSYQSTREGKGNSDTWRFLAFLVAGAGFVYYLSYQSFMFV